jgi:hypothetical protein
MWILPKQLHTLDSVQGTEALSLGLEESSQLCAQSLFVRSKPSPLRTWLAKWKRDSWTQHLYGRILNPSRGKAFETEWTSLLEVTHANHSPQQESEQERMTQDTCGLGSQTEFGFCDQECASLRTSKDTSRWDSPASSATWKSWVTRCRGAYSLRVKSAHPTNASGCSSWPTAKTQMDNSPSELSRRTPNLASVVHMVQAWQTPTTNMDMVRSEEGIQKRKEFRASIGRKSIPDGNLGEQMQRVIKHGHPAPANHSTDGNRQESWATPQASDHIEGRRTDLDSNQKCLGRDMKQWSTPSTMLGSMYVEHNADKRNSPSLATQAAWATPIMGDSHLASTPEVAQKRIEEGKVTLSRQNPGKLNPRWVETLMGLPIGWTMPSCTRPVTIELTNCDCLETESCQPQPSEHLELF